MSKGQKITSSELQKQGWIFDKYENNYEVWVNNFIIAYLYFDSKTGIIIGDPVYIFSK